MRVRALVHPPRERRRRRGRGGGGGSGSAVPAAATITLAKELVGGLPGPVEEGIARIEADIDQHALAVHRRSQLLETALALAQLAQAVKKTAVL